MRKKFDASSDAVIKQLIANLVSQLEMHQVLLEALTFEGQLPASCALVDLKEIQTIRDFAVKRIQELEVDRLRLIDQYKLVKGIHHNISLQDIADLSCSRHQQQLKKLRDDLLHIINEIKPAGRKNAEIAVARISCFNEIQGVIDKSFKRLSTYSGKGSITRGKGTSRLNRAI